MARFKAKAMGFYVGRRRPGDVFEGPDNLEGSWFERVDGAADDKSEGPPHEDGPRTLGEAAKLLTNSDVDLA